MKKALMEKVNALNNPILRYRHLLKVTLFPKFGGYLVGEKTVIELFMDKFLNISLT